MREQSGNAGHPGPVGRETMSPSLKEARNYYRWIASEFVGMLGHHVLDIGGGEGPLLEYVLDDQRETASMDLSAECVAALEARYAGRRFRGVVGDIADPRVCAALADLRFDTIVCVNVLEHVADDERALSHMAEILRSEKGRLFLLVPAHPLLYGTPDLLAGHHRRYTRRILHDRLSGAGFRIQRLDYFNRTGALPYLVNSRLLKPKSLGGGVDRQIVLFDRWIVPVARHVERWLRLPFGQSLVAECQVGRT